MFADGRFFTPSGRARFIAIPEPVLAEAPDADFPFLLNTGWVRDQWHTMTRTGLSLKLARHTPDPFVEVNPDDASKLGLNADGFARVSTAHGSAVLRVKITAAQVPGRIFAPIHWNDETAARARVGALVHLITDPHSGQPDSKAVPATLAPVFYAAHGFVLSRARRRHRLCMERHRGRLCGALCDQRAFRRLVRGLAARSPGAGQATYNDSARGIFRAAPILDERLEAVVFFGREGEVPPWSGLAEVWRLERLDATARPFLLAGRTASTSFDASPTICACFGAKNAKDCARTRLRPDTLGTRVLSASAESESSSGSFFYRISLTRAGVYFAGKCSRPAFCLRRDWGRGNEPIADRIDWTC